MAITKVGTPGSYAAAGTESSSTFSVTVPAGTTKLLVSVGVVGSSAQTISSVVFNTSESLSVGKTQAHTDFTSNVDAIYYRDNPTATTANVVVTYSGSIRPTCEWVCFSGTATGVGTTAGSTTSMSTSLNVATTSMMASFANASVNSDVTAITVANGQTVAAQTAHPNGSGGKSGLAYLAGTGSAQTLSWTPTGTPDDQGIVAVELTATAAGPTINTQPQAQTAILAGPYAVTSATWTVSATGTGTLHYAWTFNSISVGTDSSSYTRTGIVSGDNGHNAQVTVTDDNGPTVSNNAALTVKAGDTVTNTSGTTQAGGTLASETTIKSDVATAGKELVRLRRYAAGVEIAPPGHVVTKS